jgi:rod shape-determining protein MreC
MPRRKRPGRSRRTLTIGLLVLASITIITLDYRGGGNSAISALKRVAHDAMSPVQSGVDAVVRPIGSFLAGAVHYGSVEDQNAKLQAEIARLQQEALQSQVALQELKSLEQLEHLPWANGIQTMTGEVVGLNTSDFEATIQLNIGSSSGVETGMPVVGGSGLVGQVTQTWSSGSTVLLITDPRSAVGVRFGAGPSPNDALVKGGGVGKPLPVEYIYPGTSLQKGELLTTSGLQDAKFPPDLPVARIVSYSSTPSSTQQTVSAEPVADLPGLQYVDVLLWQPAQ